MSDTNLQIEYTGQSHIGMVRSENQDSFGKTPENDLDLYNPKGQLFIVADGMGGHKGGKQASSIAVETIGKIYSESYNNPAEALLEAILQANKKIYSTAESSPDLSRMGTTCTSLLIIEDKAIIGHVGDSRIYRVENGKIEQLTNDHTKVQEMLREGVLSPEEAKVYPSKSVLARALGVEEKVKVDILTDITIKDGQTFVICSDGMAKVTDQEIIKIVSENSTETACRKFIELSNERGGKDNVTVQVIRVKSRQDGTSETQKAVRTKTKSGRSRKFILPVLLLIIILIAGYQFRSSISGLFSTANNTNLDMVQADSLSSPGDFTSSDLNIELLSRANKYYEAGRVETALDLYKEILDAEPMNLAALQGVNKIVADHISAAETLMDENNFQQASEILNSILLIQPENKNIRYLLNICENQMLFANRAEDDNRENENPIPAPDEMIIVNEFKPGDWNFINIPSNHYTLNLNEIELSATSSKKLILYKHRLANVELSVELNAQFTDNNSSAGIVFGYGQNSSKSGTNYFMLSCSKNLFTLSMVNDSRSDQILKMEAPVKVNNQSSYNLKITCLEKKIFVFSDSRLLGNWESDNLIAGQVGFSASPDILVNFSNIHIRGLSR